MIAFDSLGHAMLSLLDRSNPASTPSARRTNPGYQRKPRQWWLTLAGLLSLLLVTASSYAHACGMHGPADLLILFPVIFLVPGLVGFTAFLTFRSKAGRLIRLAASTRTSAADSTPNPFAAGTRTAPCQWATYGLVFGVSSLLLLITFPGALYCGGRAFRQMALTRTTKHHQRAVWAMTLGYGFLALAIWVMLIPAIF